MLFVVLRGLGCAECSDIYTASAFYITLKYIKCIWQAVKGKKTSECISQEGHLQQAAVITEFFQEITLFFFFLLLQIGPDLAVNTW